MFYIIVTHQEIHYHKAYKNSSLTKVKDFLIYQIIKFHSIIDINKRVQFGCFFYTVVHGIYSKEDYEFLVFVIDKRKLLMAAVGESDLHLHESLSLKSANFVIKSHV